MMKLLWTIVLVACVAAVMADAQPAKGKTKRPNCPDVCTADYNPVCAADLNDSQSTPRLFGNKCVLSTHNCEHNSRLVEVDQAKCKKTGGIRLS